MIGKIKIHQLEVNCILGVYPEERKRPQKIFLEVEVGLDFAKNKSDSTSKNTIDWFVLSKKISERMIEKKFFLAEEACLDLARWILKNPLALEARVAIFKKKNMLDNLESFEAELVLKK